MSAVVQFFSFLWRAFKRCLSFLVSMPGMLFSGVLGLATAFHGIIHQINDYHSIFHVSLDTATEKVAEVSQYVSNNSAFNMISHIMALDVAWECFSSALSFCLGVFGVVFWLFFVWFWMIGVTFFTVKILNRAIRLVSAGFINP